MAKKTTTTSEIPKFTIERPKGKKTVVGKIALPTITWEALPATLEKLIGEADAVSPIFVRGTLTLYGASETPA